MQNTSLKFQRPKSKLFYPTQNYLNSRYLFFERSLEQFKTDNKDNPVKMIPKLNFYNQNDEDNLDILSLDQASQNAQVFDILQHVNQRFIHDDQQSLISHSETRNTLKRGMNEQSSIRALQDENKELKQIIEDLKQQNQLKNIRQNNNNKLFDLQSKQQQIEEINRQIFDNQLQKNTNNFDNFQQKIENSERLIKVLYQQNEQLKINQQKQEENFKKNLEILNEKNKRLEELIQQNFVLREKVQQQSNDQFLKKSLQQNKLDIQQQQLQINNLQSLIETDQNNFFTDKYIQNQIAQTDRKFTFQPTQSQIELNESEEHKNVFQQSNIHQTKNFQVSQINCLKDELLSNLSFDKSSPLYKNHNPFKKQQYIADQSEMRNNLLSANDSYIKLQSNSHNVQRFKGIKDSFNLNHCQDFKVYRQTRQSQRKKKVIRLDNYQQLQNFK